MLPKESGQFIAKLSKNVKVANDKVAELSVKIYYELLDGNITPSAFSDHPCHPAKNEAALNWIFLIDTLNFCFWNDEGHHWEVEWKGNTYTGYFALCAAINKAIDNGVYATDPRVYSQWQLSDLEYILKGNNEIQPLMMQERLDCVRQVGKKLLDKYQGNFINCVKESQHSAQKLLQLIVTEFPCYADEAVYGGEKVSFYKRAQILIGDVWACFEGQGLGEFEDIDTITMFADYRVPQVLVHFGVLYYSYELYEKLADGITLRNGSSEEVEIRGCAIEAVERVKERVNELMQDSEKPLLCNSILIDHFLWTYRRSHREETEHVPFHKTLCIYY